MVNAAERPDCLNQVLDVAPGCQSGICHGGEADTEAVSSFQGLALLNPITLSSALAGSKGVRVAVRQACPEPFGLRRPQPERSKGSPRPAEVSMRYAKLKKRPMSGRGSAARRRVGP